MTVYQAGIVSMKVTVNAMDCPRCGVVFGITADLEKRRREDGEVFYCPNGHTMGYKGEIDQLRKKNRELADDRNAAWVEAGRLQDEVAKKDREVKRIQRRANAGLCPVCNRSFVQVRRHLSKRHPNHALSHEPEPVIKSETA